jgi:superfamily I DNA/RNA helicase
VRPTTLVPGRELRAAAGRVRGPGRITTHESADDRAEAAWIAASIDRLLGGASLHSLDTGRADGHVGGRIGLSDIAVLYRTDAQASALGQALTRAGLPFQKRSHDLLTRRTAVPGIIHAMRLAAQATPDPRPGTAVNGPQDATGQGTATAAGQPGNPDATASDLTNAAGQHRNSPQAPAMPADAVPAPAVPAPGAPAGSIEPDTSAPGAVTPRGTTAGTTVAELLAGAVRRLSAEAGGSGAAVDVLAAGEVLTPLARRCGSDLARFLTEISLGAEVDALDPRADAVTLLTLHAAKGLEYAAVFLAGCERGLLPLWLPGGKAGTDEAEERRLLFVGMTRARTHLFLSWAVTRRRRGATGDTGPSPFLRAIDPALLDRSRAATPRPPAPKQLRLL